MISGCWTSLYQDTDATSKLPAEFRGGADGSIIPSCLERIFSHKMASYSTVLRKNRILFANETIYCCLAILNSCKYVVRQGGFA